MKTSLSWIQYYVPELDCTPSEYVDALTLTGTKVENFERLDKNVDKVVVGLIKSIEKHPDADKLQICKVDVGEENLLQIVTAAQNVFEGAYVPLVRVGGTVVAHNEEKGEFALKIKKGKLRGVESEGMFCSVEELGSHPSMYPEAMENGIYIFEEPQNLGSDAIQLLGRRDVQFEYEITSNRVDCYSILGIAREASATFRKAFRLPPMEVQPSSGNVCDEIQVEIKDYDLCSRYVGAVIKNVKIEPSPKWMQNALRSVGIRPINNLVDITNFVMEELGQPMHAYDLSQIADRKIVVQKAKENEEFVTLDGKKYILSDDILMICDGQKPVGIAGIMGGENSMIQENVESVLLEAACFEGTNIRLSSKKLGLRTDASTKFEKGLHTNTAILAMKRACHLIQSLGYGEVVNGFVDVYENLHPDGYELDFEPERINQFLGTQISKEEMLTYFKYLEITFDEASGKLRIPYFRNDIEGFADLAEEVARFFGYDKIPMTLPKGETLVGGLPKHLELENKIRKIVEFGGFSEAMSYSFESPKVFDKLRLSEDDELRKAIPILNPLGEDYSLMRTSLFNGLLSSLSTNFNRRNANVHLYEIGKVYLPKALPLRELPVEKRQLILGFYGEGDFFSLKGSVEAILDKLNVKGLKSYDDQNPPSYMHPGRFAHLCVDDKSLGFLGEVHPEVCKTYHIKGRVYIALIDLERLATLTEDDVKYQGVPRFPASTRDISMLVPIEVKAAEIEEKIRDNGGQFLEKYALFDLFEGNQIEQGFKSMAYKIIFRNKEATLEEKQITEAMESILKSLEALGCQLRQ